LGALMLNRGYIPILWMDAPSTLVVLKMERICNILLY